MAVYLTPGFFEFPTNNSEGNEIYHEHGAFGNYISAKGDIQIKIPENLSFEEAATLGVGITTYVHLLQYGVKY
jgi:NADPH:quinone reductase-like Zn-dependent oxidoreductase